MRPHGAIKNEKAQLGACEGVAEAGHPLDAALTVAHAVWYFAGVPRGPPQRTRAYPVAARLNPVRGMGAGCLAAFECVGSWRSNCRTAQRFRFVGCDVNSERLV